MEFLTAISNNLLSPAMLFFALGIAAGFVKSDLEVPESISRYLSLYLMMAIGFKGGVAIAGTESISAEIIYTVLAGIVIGFVQPFVSYGLLKKTTSLDSPTAAAVAAHYGSISMVTFVTATSFLKAHEVVYAGYIVAVLALMEAPAIFSGLFIAHRAAPETRSHEQEERRLISHDIFTNGAILLLLGAFLIGWITGEPGMKQVGGFLREPFHGILCLFLLDMGLMVAKNLQPLRHFTFSLIAFGIYMPVIGALTGLAASALIGLDIGTGMLFTVLCASASYIAVPAAMRLALPEASPTVYVPMSLAITFPLNVTLGIPFYFELAKAILPPS